MLGADIGNGNVCVVGMYVGVFCVFVVVGVLLVFCDMLNVIQFCTRKYAIKTIQCTI